MAQEVGNVQLFIQTIVYCCIVVLGLIITIPVGITKNKLKCPLYGSFLQTKGGINYFDLSSSTCSFVLNLHVALTIYASLHVLIHIYVIIERRVRHQDSQLLWLYQWNPLSVTLHALTTIMALVAACMISVGLSTFCKELRQHLPDITSCAQEQRLKWAGGLDGSSFYDCLSVAMGGCWLAVGAWLGQTGLRVLSLYKAYRRQPTAEPFQE